MIHFILGTRAQLIKTGPLMHAYKEKGIDYNFIFLAQHKETMYEIMDDYEIKHPDIVIGDIGKDVTKTSQMILWSIKVLFTLITKNKKIFKGDKDGVVFVHGDAPPVFLGALAAKIRGLKVGLIESGLRSFDWFNPFPEELTRVVTWALGLVDYHFCTDDKGVENLRKFKGEKIKLGLNTMFDAQMLASKLQHKAKVELPKEKYALVTIHRFETITNAEQFEEVVSLIEKIADQIKLLFILHPPTKVALEKFDMYERLDKNPNIELRPRYLFFDFNKLLINSEFIITDGGSNQEECYYQGKPCLLFRKATERQEGLGENAVLSMLEPDLIMDFVQNYEKYKREPLSESLSPSRKIIEFIESKEIDLT